MRLRACARLAPLPAVGLRHACRCVLAATCAPAARRAAGRTGRATSAQPEPSPPPSRTEDDAPKIVVLGDSLTAGLGLLETQAYPALLQKKIDDDGYKFEVVNAGVSGDTSAGGLRRLDWALAGGRARS